MFESSSIELSLNALKSNIRFLKKLVGKDVRISSVVKGNAYGHGIGPFVKMASKCGIDHFSVFSADEAYEVKNTLLDNTPIMIMGAIGRDAMEWAITNNVEFYVFEKKRLLEAVKISQRIFKQAKIHIEVETGMNRTGFSIKEIPSIIKLLRKHQSHVVFKGLCTHFAGAENSANHERIKGQIATFQRVKKLFDEEGLLPEIFHAACSASTIIFPETRMGLVRIGIMQYGFWSSQETFEHYRKSANIRKSPLKRVISWKSEVMSIKLIKKGEFVGYGASFQAPNKMRVAAIPVGYANGFGRSLSNLGQVLVQGVICPVIGIVNMNILMIDVTHVLKAQVGDEAVLIGTQGKNELTVASFSELSVQLNYELLTRLSQNITRKIIY